MEDIKYLERSYNRFELNLYLDYMESYYTKSIKYKEAGKFDEADVCFKTYLDYKAKAAEVLFRLKMVPTDEDLAMKKPEFKYYNQEDPDRKKALDSTQLEFDFTGKHD